MNRGRVIGNHDVGVFVVGRETSAELADVHILDTRSEVSNGTGGRGLLFSSVPRWCFQRASSRTIERSGFFASHEDTSVELIESKVSGTRVARCEEDAALDCPLAGRGFGDGILALGGAHIGLNAFELTGNARVGLYLYDTGDALGGAPTLDVFGGLIMNNDYGINFSGGTISPSDFAGKEVACYDNPATIDGCFSEVQLEVPSVADAVEDLAR